MYKVLKSAFMNPGDDVVHIPDMPTLHSLPGAIPGATPEFEEAYKVMVARAKEESTHISSKIVEMAHRERDAMLLQARQEGEALKKQAWQEGYAAGVDQKLTELAQALADLQETIEELHREHDAYFEWYTCELKRFAADIAEKILYEKIDEDALSLVKLVRQAVGMIRNAEWISVEVCEQLPPLVRFLEEAFSSRDRGETRVEVVGKPLPPGSCILRTPDGTIDASISAQLQNLQELFTEMDEQEEGVIQP